MTPLFPRMTVAGVGLIGGSLALAARAAGLVGAFVDARVAGRRVLDYAGSGYRDVTRIAASRPELWRDIALANRSALRAALAEFRAALDRLEGLLVPGSGDALEAVLGEAAAARRRLGGER